MAVKELLERSEELDKLKVPGPTSNEPRSHRPTTSSVIRLHALTCVSYCVARTHPFARSFSSLMWPAGRRPWTARSSPSHAARGSSWRGKNKKGRANAGGKNNASPSSYQQGGPGPGAGRVCICTRFFCAYLQITSQAFSSQVKIRVVPTLTSRLSCRRSVFSFSHVKGNSSRGIRGLGSNRCPKCHHTVASRDRPTH